MLGRCTVPQKLLNLEKSNNGQEFEINTQTEIIVSLEANPTTGYTWSISNLDTSLIKLIKESTLEADSQKLGAPGKQVFHFLSISPGVTELNLIYHREWEKQIAPLDTFQVVVRITE